MNPVVDFKREWWPICHVCGKVVDNVQPVPIMGNPDKFQLAIRDYIVTCHGQRERSFVGIWAAWEIASGHKRLPEAFVKKAIDA